LGIRDSGFGTRDSGQWSVISVLVFSDQFGCCRRKVAAKAWARMSGFLLLKTLYGLARKKPYGLAGFARIFSCRELGGRSGSRILFHTSSPGFQIPSASRLGGFARNNH